MGSRFSSGIPVGAAVGRLSLPIAASTAPAVIPRKGNRQTLVFLFQLWGRHCWRYGANEGLSVSITGNPKVRATPDRETRPVSSLVVSARHVAERGSGFPRQSFSSGAYGAQTVERLSGCRQSESKLVSDSKHDIETLRCTRLRKGKVKSVEETERRSFGAQG
jgi:hypothetical protein